MSKNLIQDEDFQIVTPTENGIFTVANLNTESSSNSGLLEDFQNVDNIPILPIETNSCFDLDNLPKIETTEELLSNLCELMIRFDGCVKDYQKADYEHLVKVITNSSINLYDKIKALENFNANLVNDKYYRHVQNTASKIWNVQHNLNKYPSVTIESSNGTIVFGEVQYIDLNNLIIKFSASFNGFANLN